MPSPELIGRCQTAVLWPITGRDAYAQPTVDEANPVEVQVRWDDTRSEKVDRDGNLIAIEAEVILDRDVAIGSLMWLGSLDDLPGNDLLPDKDVMVVKFKHDQPDLKNRFTAHEVSLMRYKDSLG